MLWEGPFFFSTNMNTPLEVETLDDEEGGVFVRVWNPRNHLELRPTWHQVLCLDHLLGELWGVGVYSYCMTQDDGPIPLERLLQAKISERYSYFVTF